LFLACAPGTLFGCSKQSDLVMSPGDAAPPSDGAAPVATVIATKLKALSRATMVSDGDTLFLVQEPQLISVPVNGGEPRILLDAGVVANSPARPFLGVDATYVYFQTTDGLFRMPKAGGTRQRVDDTGTAHLVVATLFKSTVYWVESRSSPPIDVDLKV